MRILFTSGRAFLPQASGGVQSSTMQLCSMLAARGHEVAVMCRLIGGDWTALESRVRRRLSKSRFSCDQKLGLPVYRAWDPTDATEVVREFRPDVAIVQSGDTMAIARSLQGLGVPVALYLRHVEFEDMGGSPADLVDARFIANSAFTASRYAEAFGIESTVIPPFVDRSLYQTPTTRETVTFINPYPVKGCDIALAVAAGCPDIPFLFCESWPINDALRAYLDQRLASLPNVTLRARTDNMKSIYSKTRILFAPSKWEEAWGRVATEAQFCGIPVLGSLRGGLPEAVGPGGVLVDGDATAGAWIAALRRLWDDPEHYRRVSEAALAHAARPEIEPEYQIGMFEDVLADAVAHIRGRGAA
jgi:glycosyltransferase involved in cell wall biosynthesis